MNEFRSIHDVDSLKINEKLNTEAQEWAQALADKDGLEHSPKEMGKWLEFPDFIYDYTGTYNLRRNRL